MRISIGIFFIIIFIGVFSLLFMETTQELSSAQSLHQVLDETVHLNDIVLSSNSKIVDRNGNNISDVFSSENRIYLPFNEIPSIVKSAFIAAEDRSFYEHPGFDMSGIARAFLVNLRSQSVQQGGSTITQQLTRNMYLSHSRTYERKLTELLYAYQLERLLTKDDIIEMYLNSIYFANGVYGIEAASQYYFDVATKDLSIAQAAFLTAIPNNPSYYNPTQHSERTDNRKDWILTKMYEQSLLNESEFTAAIAEKIILHTYEKQDQYPDYVTYVFHELEKLVSKQEGFDERLQASSTEEETSQIKVQLQEKVAELLSSGITIETALDTSIQSHAVTIINKQLGNSLHQGATSIIDHDHREIVAITGGTSYRKFDFHRGFQAYRQPGSAIKPLLVFAPLLQETNLNSQSIIEAGPFQRNDYEPQNFGGATFAKVSLEEALINSYNTAAVRLLDMIEIETGFSYLNKFDFERIVSTDYVLPSALGGFTNGVSVNEMTKAYSSFATNGDYHSPKAIRQVVGANGDILYRWELNSAQIWNEHTVNNMREILSKVIQEGTGRGAQIANSNSEYLGGKTGTTNNFYDLWFIGSNDSYTIGVWIGNDSPSSLHRESELGLHTKLWRDIMAGIESPES